MLNSDTSATFKKKEVITNCIHALASANAIDVNKHEANEALANAIAILETYPNIKALKRHVLKVNSADHFAFKAYNLMIGISLSAERTYAAFGMAIDYLANAFQQLQQESKDLNLLKGD